MLRALSSVLHSSDSTFGIDRVLHQFDRHITKNIEHDISVEGLIQLLEKLDWLDKFIENPASVKLGSSVCCATKCGCDVFCPRIRLCQDFRWTSASED